MMRSAWLILSGGSLAFGLSGGAMAQSSAPGSFNVGAVNVQLGGFAASETVYRNNNMESDIATPFAKIPFDNSPATKVTEFRGTERQSRLSILMQGSESATTHIAGYYEFDFLGAAGTANPNESNSFNPRTRNVYMNIDWEGSGLHLLAGQNWSLLTLNTSGITPRTEAPPSTIDAQYAVGFDWARQWQLRLVKDFNKTFWLGASAENSQTVGVAGSARAGTGNAYQLPAGANFNPGSSMSMNNLPDFVVKAALDPGFGHYEIFGLERNFTSLYGGATVNTQTQKQSTWSGSAGAGLVIPAVPRLVDLSATYLSGYGAGRYGTTGLSDATYGEDGSLKPLKSTDYMAQLTAHLGGTFDLYGIYGQEAVDGAVGANNAFGYGDGMVASNDGCNHLGMDCSKVQLKSAVQENLGFWWSFYKGSYGATKLGVQASRTTLNTFKDKNGLAPSANEDMVLTSLRYYPF